MCSRPARPGRIFFPCPRKDMRTRQPQLRGGVGFTTEIGGRDRFKFFRRPVEAEPNEFPGEGAARESAFLMNPPGDPMLQWDDNTGNQLSSTSPSMPGAPLGLRLKRAAKLDFRSTDVGRRLRSAAGTRAGSERYQLDSAAQGLGKRRARPHHLPSLQSATSAPNRSVGGVTQGGYVKDDDLEAATPGMREIAVQTMYRENDTQTDPYSPDYYIPDDAPKDPEILQLQGLTWQNKGLPAGQEEIELIQRLRRRREVERSLDTTSKDPAVLEANYAKLRELEELEWKEREEHVEKLHARRLERIKDLLMEQEKARESANESRLAQIKENYMSNLREKLKSLYKRRMARSHQIHTQRHRHGYKESLNSSAKPMSGPRIRNAFEGSDKCKPETGFAPLLSSQPGSTTQGASAPRMLVGTTMPLQPQQYQQQRALAYDVRPTFLCAVEGVEDVDRTRSARIEQIPADTFRVPQNAAIQALPTVYRRREAERVVQSLQYAQSKIDEAKGIVSDYDTSSPGPAKPTAAQVLDLYRLAPKVQRPDTPELELEGDAEEEIEDACILLQRLLRGRAVQNDFFEGKERFQGLIKELQAASDVKRAEELNMESSQALEAEASRQEEKAIEVVLDTALGDIIGDTLGYLFQELQRQQDADQLEQVHIEAVAAREQREAAELARREAARAERECMEVQYKALVRATRITAATFLQELSHKVVKDTALQMAVDHERERQALLPPRDPTDPIEKENLVCDILDHFLIPVVLDQVEQQGRELEKKAVVSAVKEIESKTFAFPQDTQSPEPDNDDGLS